MFAAGPTKTRHGVRHVFPALLATGGESAQSDFGQVIQYFAPVLPRILIIGLPVDDECSQSFLKAIIPNPRYAFKLLSKYFGGGDCEQYALLASPSPPGCENIWVKLRGVSILYFENVEVVPNAYFDVTGGWKVRAMSLSMQSGSDLAVDWLAVLAPNLAMLGSVAYQDAAYAQLRKVKEVKNRWASGDHGRMTNWRVTARQNTNVSKVNNTEESKPTRPSHQERLLIQSFPSFPAATLVGMPVKYAYLLHNYMAHVAYVQLCCFKRDAAMGNLTHCGFCISNPQLCPCDKLFYPGEPTVDFVFPTL